MGVEKDNDGRNILGQFKISDDNEKELTMYIIPDGISVNGIIIPVDRLAKLSRELETIPGMGDNGEVIVLCAEDKESKLVFKKNEKEKKVEVITTSRCEYTYSVDYLNVKKKETRQFDGYKNLFYKFSIEVVKLFVDMIDDIRADLKAKPLPPTPKLETRIPPTSPLPNLPESKN